MFETLTGIHVQNWKTNSTTTRINDWKTYRVMGISIFAIMIK